MKQVLGRSRCWESKPWGHWSAVSQISLCLQWPLLLGNNIASRSNKNKKKAPPVFLMESRHLVLAETGNSGWHGSSSTPVTPAPPAPPLQAQTSPIYIIPTHTRHMNWSRAQFLMPLNEAPAVGAVRLIRARTCTYHFHNCTPCSLCRVTFKELLIRLVGQNSELITT